VIELTLACLVGCGLGTAAGILPGFSSSTIMIATMPLLLLLPPNMVIAFYIGLVTLTQYFGGASSSLLGIPTENSCLPSVTEGYALVRNNKTKTALSSGAAASFCGSVIAIVISLILCNFLTSLSYIFNYTVQLVLLTATFILVCSANGKYISNITLCIWGYLVASVGINKITNEPFATFNNPYLFGGLPSSIVLLSFYSLPLVLCFTNSATNTNSCMSSEKVKLPLITLLRSSIIGYICGFIPMLSIVISSNLSYAIEKKLRGSNYTVGDANCLSASDCAHNSGLIASLIPLFVFAIPIVPSEYVLYDVVTRHGASFSYAWLQSNILWIGCGFALANCIGYLCAYPLAIQLVRYLTKNFALLKYSSVIILVFCILLIGFINDSMVFYLVITAVFLPLGLILRKFDKMPFVIGLLVGPQYETVARIIYGLYGN